MKRTSKMIAAALGATMLLGSVGFAAVSAAETEPDASVGALVAAGEEVSALNTPKITRTQNIDGGVRIYWDAVEGAEAYRVFYLGRSGWKGMGNTTETSFVDDDVNSGSTYTYTVRCVKKDGSEFTSDYDKNGFKATYIAKPKLSYAESVYGGVEIGWEAPKGATKYRVFYKGASGWRRMGDTTETTFLDDVVTSGKTYQYTVRCISDDGEEYVSSFDDAGIFGTYYAAPVIKSAESIDGGVKLSWDAVPGVYKYRVYYKGRNGWTRFGETTGTSFVDDDVNSGSTYTYTIRGLNSDDDFITGYNKEGWKGTYIAVPQISGFTNTLDGAQLTWAPVKGATKYRVFYKDGNSWVGINNTTDTTFVDTEVESGKERTYTVRCVDNSGNYVSDYSRTGWTNTYVGTPYIYRYTTDADTNVTIYWSKCDGAAAYRVFYYSGGTWKGLGNTSSTEFKIKQNPAATVYTVRALDKNGSFASDYDHVGVTVRRDGYAQDIDTYVPRFLSSKISENHNIALTWDAIPGAALYNIYLETADGGLKKIGESEERSCTITKSTLGTNLAGKTFTFRLRAVDRKGKFISQYSPSGYDVTYPEALNIVGKFTTTAKDAVNVSWKAVEKAETYKIYMYHNYSLDREIETSKLSYNIRLEKPEDYYAFEVQAYDKEGNIIAIPGNAFEVNP
ncbi:MAG: hypothetical protein II498_09025 [Ruminococcus sp.]|nr:hypothetical protein [Ruminococcus sp.]